MEQPVEGGDAPQAVPSEEQAAVDMDEPIAPGGALVIEEEDPLNLPPHGTEVFMGGLHRSTTDEQLREFASEAGEVYSIKLVRDPSNPALNRGYGFVRYVTKEAALVAMDRLVSKELPEFPGHKVRVAPAQVKNKLFMGGIPNDKTKEEVETLLQTKVKGLEKVDLVMSKENPSSNRGFAFLEFYNSACAQLAKTIISSPDFKIGDRNVTVDFAEPTARDPLQTAVKSIFVGNLTANVTEDSLKELFSQYGEVEKVNLPKPREGGDTHAKYGFVHFKERLSAAKAVEAVEKPTLDGIELSVKYGKTDDPKSAYSLPQGGPGGRGGSDYDFAHGGRGRGRGGRGGYHHQGGHQGGYGGYNAAPYYQYPQHPQQHQPHYQGGYAATYGGGGGGGAMAPGGGGMMGGSNLVPVVPVQLLNGQIGYMLQQGTGIDDGSGGPMRGRGGWAGGRGGGYNRGGYAGGRGGGGRGRGGPNGGPRYQPY